MTIKELRKAAGMTQKRFAEELNIPKRTIEEWEGNRRTPPKYITELIEFRLKKEIENNLQKGVDKSLNA